MNIRMIEKYRAKQRRNRALIFSLIVHAIVIIVIAIWLLKPLVEQEEDSITVDFVSSPQRIHVPKKIVQEVPQGNNAPSDTADTVHLSTPSIRQIGDTSRLEPPSLSTIVDLRPSPESILQLSDKSPTIETGTGEINGRSAGEKVGRRDNGSGTGLGNLTQSEDIGQDAFGEGVPDVVGSYEDEIGDKLGECY